jgi:hypothetical protein
MKLATSILFLISSFLTLDEYHSCKQVNNLWKNILKSDTNLKLLSKMTRTCRIKYIKRFKFPKFVHNFGLHKQNIIVSLFRAAFSIYDSDGKKIGRIKLSNRYYEIYSTFRICANDKYICSFDNGNIKIFTDVNKPADYSWNINISNIFGFIEHNEYIFLTTVDKICKYDFNGNLCCENKLPSIEKGTCWIFKNMTAFNETIFMVDSCFKCVRVFSLDCKEITTWHNEKLNYPRNISINNNYIYVLDKSNIFIFDINGNFIHEIFNTTLININFTNNQIYVTNTFTNMFVFSIFP